MVLKEKFLNEMKSCYSSGHMGAGNVKHPDSVEETVLTFYLEDQSN